MSRINFEFCDYGNPQHLTALVDLLNHYMSDPMGDYPSHDKKQQLHLVDGLANHPSAFVLFILCDGTCAGLATCFVNFSTFKIKPYLYIHDIVVHKDFRGRGLGRSLMKKLISISKERDYCKITLEVREDNATAMALYQSMGFDECEPKMLFWTKTL
ncbi:MAG: GNAT family N-acetyltransferase [Bacteroidales bacterium]|nr:GNAT family N-acetyltransferase [Bacteroidales bacterium]